MYIVDLHRLIFFTYKYLLGNDDILGPVIFFSLILIGLLLLYNYNVVNFYCTSKWISHTYTYILYTDILLNDCPYFFCFGISMVIVHCFMLFFPRNNRPSDIVLLFYGLFLKLCEDTCISFYLFLMSFCMKYFMINLKCYVTIKKLHIKQIW